MLELAKAVRKAHQFKHLRLTYYRLGLDGSMPDIIQGADSSLQNLGGHSSLTLNSWKVSLSAPLMLKEPVMPK